ncbi:MAG: ATP-binding protein [Actinomycetes bacterium]
MEHGHDDELVIGLPAEDTAVRTARATAESACRQWAVATVAVEIVSLVVSELTTNVVRHVGGAFRLLVRHERGAIRVEVEDLLDCPSPRAMRLDPVAEGGRGLLLVERLARSWGCVPTEQGKRMWALIAA